MPLTLKRHLPSCLVLMRQRSDLGQRWRGCTWNGNQAFPCSLLLLSALGALIMQPSTLSTASCPKREAMPPGASGHTKPNAQFSPWMGANKTQDRAQFCGDEIRSICHQLMYQGCVYGGGPSWSPSGGEVWPHQSFWQPGRVATNHKADRLIYYLNSWRLPQAEKIKSSQRVKQMKKTPTSVFGADRESGKRSSPASQDDGGTNRAPGFGKWLLVTVGMTLISIVIGENRTLLYEQGGTTFLFTNVSFFQPKAWAWRCAAMQSLPSAGESKARASFPYNDHNSGWERENGCLLLPRLAEKEQELTIICMYPKQ